MRTFKSDHVPAPPFCLLWNQINKYSSISFEIGAGNGEFSRHFCPAHPSNFLISIERTQNKSFSALNHPLYTNQFFLRADAISVLVHCVPDDSLDQIFILYPNPYPKKSQSNQRWYNMPFVQLLKKKLKNSGHLEIRTNIAEYYEQALHIYSSTWGFKVSRQETLIDVKKAQTAFERKYLARNEICYRALLINCK